MRGDWASGRKTQGCLHGLSGSKCLRRLSASQLKKLDEGSEHLRRVTLAVARPILAMMDPLKLMDHRSDVVVSTKCQTFREIVELLIRQSHHSPVPSCARKRPQGEDPTLDGWIDPAMVAI